MVTLLLALRSRAADLRRDSPPQLLTLRRPQKSILRGNESCSAIMSPLGLPQCSYHSGLTVREDEEKGGKKSLTVFFWGE